MDWMQDGTFYCCTSIHLFCRLKFLGKFSVPIFSFSVFLHLKPVSSLLWLCDADVRLFGPMWGCVGQFKAMHSLHRHHFPITAVVFCVCVLVCSPLSSILWAALLIWSWSAWNSGSQHRQLGRRQRGRTSFLQNFLFKKWPDLMKPSWFGCVFFYYPCFLLPVNISCASVTYLHVPFSLNHNKWRNI